MPPMVTPRRSPSSSRYSAANGSAASKRRTTEAMKQERPSTQRTTAKDVKPASQRIAAVAPAPAPAQKAPSSTRIPAQGVKPPSSATVPAAQAQAKAPSSSRIPAQSAKAPSSARLSAARSDSGSRNQRAPSSSRNPASASQRKDATKSSRRVAAKGKGGSRAMYIVIGVVVLGAIAGFSWGPYNLGRKISAMDAAKTDASKMDAALKASDDFLGMVGGNQHRVKDVIIAGHGPVEVQIHLAEKAGLLSQLAAIADRSNITPAQRAAALGSATEIYERDKHASERLPTALSEWAVDASQTDEVAVAAIKLIARAGREDAPAVLSTIASTAGISDARLTAAFDGLSKHIGMESVGYGIALFVGANRERALGNTQIKDAVAKSSTGQLEKMLDLAFSDNRELRIWALTCLGEHGGLPDAASSDAKRKTLSSKFAPLLVKSTPPEELAAALKAVKRLALTPSINELLTLVPELNVLALPGVDNGFMSECLGKDFILKGSDAAKAESDLVVKKLSASLADSHKRFVCAGALKLVALVDLPSLRAALDKLAEVGDKDCVEALKALVGQTYGRADVVKVNGESGEAWKKWLAEDHLQSDRINAIHAWYAENSKTTRVSDGKDKLQASKDFIEKAQTEVSGWLKNAKWVPPLGFTKQPIDELDKQLKMLNKDVGNALAGAKQQ